MLRHIAIVTPVLDDWESFAALVAEISERYSGGPVRFEIFALDDGSSVPFDLDTIVLPPNSCIGGIELIRLAANLGHQRAIAVGLCAIAGRAFDAAIVMDSDGEDRPGDIATLLAENERRPADVIFAERTKRTEARSFRACYAVYKFLFHALTGRTINFGNFVLIPMAAVQRLVHMPELWNNLAAAIMRSRLRYSTVPTIRGVRYAGRSTMNFVALIVHGLSAMSVYTDAIFVRIMIAAGIVGVLSLSGIFVVAAIRFVTDLAIPGWATTVVGDLLIVLMQTAVVMIATSLTMLAGRSNRPIIPIVDAQSFVARREQWRDRPAGVKMVSVR